MFHEMNIVWGTFIAIFLGFDDGQSTAAILE